MNSTVLALPADYHDHTWRRIQGDLARFVDLVYRCNACDLTWSL